MAENWQHVVNHYEKSANTTTGGWEENGCQEDLTVDREPPKSFYRNDGAMEIVGNATLGKWVLTLKSPPFYCSVPPAQIATTATRLGNVVAEENGSFSLKTTGRCRAGRLQCNVRRRILVQRRPGQVLDEGSMSYGFTEYRVIMRIAYLAIFPILPQNSSTVAVLSSGRAGTAQQHRGRVTASSAYH